MIQDAAHLLPEDLPHFHLALGRLRAGVVETIANLLRHEEEEEATHRPAHARLHREGTGETESEADLTIAVKIEADPRHHQKPLAHVHLDHGGSALLPSHHAVAHRRAVAHDEDTYLPYQALAPALVLAH